MAPEGTPVEKIYKAMIGRGVSKSVAAATAQKRTGLALSTGKPPKGKKKPTKKKDSKKHEKSESMKEMMREKRMKMD